MPPSNPFIDANTGTLDTDGIVEEAIPLAKLIGIIGVIAYAPLAILAIGYPPGFTIVHGLPDVFTSVFTVASQFLLAVGSSVVLLYVISRALQLSRE